jgi:hypothetical protein
MNSNLYAVIGEVKEGFRIIGFKTRDLILKLGNELIKTLKPEDVCEKIKHILNEEIREGLILPRSIERYCLDNWKKKTKPKKPIEKDNLSLSEEKNLMPPMLVGTDGKTVQSPDTGIEDNQVYSKMEPEIEEIDLEEIHASHIKNLDSDNGKDNRKEQTEFEITVPFNVIRKLILVPLNKQIGTKNFLIHGTIDKKTSKVISAWAAGLLDTSKDENKEE